MSLNIGGNSVESVTLTKAWGLTPASGRVSLLGGAPPPDQEVSLTIDNFNFQGLVRSSEKDTSFEGGNKYTIQIVDFRWRLRDDVVFAYFNRVEEVPDPAVPNKRRYVHLYPENWEAGTITVTESPLTARAILQKAFSASTVRHPWVLASHPALLSPVFNADAEKGKELGAFLQEILDQLGLILTIDTKTNLRVGVKGAGVTPGIPKGVVQSTIGTALTDAGTNLHIVGDRNVFQGTLNLAPGWNRRWEAYWNEPNFLELVESIEEFGDGAAGRAKLAERARTITVGEIATAKGSEFIDRRIYGDASRMDIPAWSYIHDLVWKFYEVDPESFPVDLASVSIRQGLIQGVEYDPDTGRHRLKDGDFYPEIGGFVTAQGQPLDALDPDRAGEFSYELISNLGKHWASVGGFKITSGIGKNKGIHFDDVVFTCKNLFIFPNKDKDDVSDEVKYLAIPNPDCVIEPAKVKASLAFEHRIFKYQKGRGVKQDTYYQAGLCEHIVSDSITGVNGGKEVVFQDGEKAKDKAKELADILLDRQPVILSGGFSRVGNAGTVLTENIDRITVVLNFNQGVIEQVDFADERQVRAFDSERELERRRKAKSLFPGQEDLKKEVQQYRQLAEALKHSGGRQKERRYTNLSDVTKRPTTSRDCSPKMISNPAKTPLKAGEIIWMAGSNSEKPNQSTDIIDPDFKSKRFAGVVIPNTTLKKQVPLATQGIVPVLVKGPVESGEVVGCDIGQKFAIAGGERTIGTAIDAIKDSNTMVIRVELSTGAGGDYKGLWNLQTRVKDDVPEVRLVNAGTIRHSADIDSAITIDEYEPDPVANEETHWLEAKANEWLYLKTSFQPNDQDHPVKIEVVSGPLDEFPSVYTVGEPSGNNSWQSMEFFNYPLFKFFATSDEAKPKGTTLIGKDICYLKYAQDSNFRVRETVHEDKGNGKMIRVLFFEPSYRGEFKTEDE
jgi:hypothetical protein